MRRGLGAFALAIVIAATAGGAALTAAVGARRSDTAYARFLTWTRHADFATGGANDDQTLARDLAAIEHAPFVAVAAHIPVVGAHVRLADGKIFQAFQVTVVDDADNALARGLIEREKVLRGRRADPSSPDDATVSFSTAERLGVDVGDRISLVADNGGRAVSVHVVGVVVRSGEFPTLSGATRSSVALTSAFRRAHPALFTPGNDGIVVRVKPGTHRAAVESWVRAHLRGTDIEDTAIGASSIERTIQLETVSLWGVAGVLSLVSMVLLGQLLFRNAVAVADDVKTIATLGFTRRQVTQLGMARGVLVGILGAAGAVGVAILASPLTPVGLGRLAEPSPGIWVDGSVLTIGGLIIVVVTVAFGAIAARRASTPPPEYGGARRLLPLPDVAPAIWVGLQTLLRPTRRSDSRLTRATVMSLGLIVAAVIAVLVMLTSLTHLRENPVLTGATWDAALVASDPPTQRAVDAARSRLTAMPEVVGVSGSGWSTVIASDREIPVQVFDDHGDIGPAIAAGRAPVRAEIALGADEMRRLGVGIGDRLQIAAQRGGRRVRVEVVGRSVLVPPVFRTTAPGDGAAVSTSTMRTLGIKRIDAAGLVIVRFRTGIDKTRALDRARRAVHANFAFASDDRTIVGGIKRVQTVPFGLVVVLGVLGGAAFVHFQIVATRRRRHDVGVLKTIGFTHRQVLSMLAVQTLTIGVAALVVGVPVGLIAGRISWTRFADYLRVVASPSTTFAVIAISVVTLLVVAFVTGLASGTHTAGGRPAQILRSKIG